uniref:Uncharacterized protein n=1 Tax=Anguilla anguilla TaxID=7936 RepID=A0A0E9P6X9_ANGAN
MKSEGIIKVSRHTSNVAEKSIMTCILQYK